MLQGRLGQWHYIKYNKGDKESQAFFYRKSDMIAAVNSEVREAVDILYEISADEKVRAEYNARQKAWMDRQSQFDGYYKKGKAEGKVEDARNLKALGIATDIITKATGLSSEEIAKL